MDFYKYGRFWALCEFMECYEWREMIIIAIWIIFVLVFMTFWHSNRVKTLFERFSVNDNERSSDDFT